MGIFYKVQEIPIQFKLYYIKNNTIIIGCLHFTSIEISEIKMYYS